MRSFIVVLLIFTFSLTYSYGQGIIRGKVTDETGQSMPGTTVLVKAKLTNGTLTDYDGNYSLKIVDSSTHRITVSFIGYQTISDSVKVINGEVVIRNYDMVPASNEIGEVTVIARSSKAKDTYMEKIKLNSSISLDYISIETIKRTGDANVTAAVSRITGVSTYGGFITVRGIGDRYIKTTINGLRIPTLDPFTNNIKLDLFPASLVDNIIVNKTASADLSGDWAGAFLNIETKDYPEKLTVGIETAVGYNSQSTFNEIVSSERSATDWLGFDNGLRNINHEKSVFYNGTYSPYLEFAIGLGLKDYFDKLGIDANSRWDDNYTRLALVQLGFLGKAQMFDNEIYRDALSRYNESDLKKQGSSAALADVIKMGQSLPNKWLTVSRNAPLDFSQSFSIGNQIQLFNMPVGYLVGFRYSSSSLYDGNTKYGRGDLLTNEVNNPKDDFLNYHTWGSGKNGVETNGWSALFNLSLKLNPNNSISFLFMPNLIGVNKVRYDYSIKRSTGSDIFYYTISQFYESRKQMVYQLKTNHFLPASHTIIKFNASYTAGKSNSPDYKQLLYEFDPQTETIPLLFWAEKSENGNFRVFRDLSEDLFDSHIIAEIPLGRNSTLPRLIKFGGAWQWLNRKADQRYYFLPARAIDKPIEDNDVAAFLNHDNFAVILADGTLKRFYFQLTGEKDNTIGFSNNLAGFLLTDYTISPALRISGGVRIEKTHMHTDIVYFYEKQLAVDDYRRQIFDLSEPPIKPAIRDEIFFLPSANIVYHLKNDKAAPANIRLNFSRSIALPSLRELTPFSSFDYSLMAEVEGQSDLKTVTINNYDLRFEKYFDSGDNFSMSLFYKQFQNHIELVRLYRNLEVNYSWQNTDNSSVAGIEFEGRIGITKNFEFRANATLVDSKTRLNSDSISREMYGQAPYIINAMVLFVSEKTGLEASVNYNLQGSKLVISAFFNNYPNIYELPRNLIDIKLTKKLGKRFMASFRIRDLLNEPIRRSYKYSAGWVDFDRYSYGTSYLFGISYNL